MNLFKWAIVVKWIRAFVLYLILGGYQGKEKIIQKVGFSYFILQKLIQIHSSLKNDSLKN